MFSLRQQPQATQHLQPSPSGLKPCSPIIQYNVFRLQMYSERYRLYFSGPQNRWKVTQNQRRRKLMDTQPTCLRKKLSPRSSRLAQFFYYCRWHD